MTPELISNIIGLWVSRYIALFCLLTLLIWGGGAYLLLDKWVKPVRDAAIYLGLIGVLTLVLALRPAKMDMLFWPPITWFCFSMLMMMELLWLTFLTDATIKGIRKFSERFSHSLVSIPTNSGTPQLPK